MRAPSRRARRGGIEEELRQWFVFLVCQTKGPDDTKPPKETLSSAHQLALLSDVGAAREIMGARTSAGCGLDDTIASALKSPRSKHTSTLSMGWPSDVSALPLVESRKEGEAPCFLAHSIFKDVLDSDRAEVCRACVTKSRLQIELPGCRIAGIYRKHKNIDAWPVRQDPLRRKSNCGRTEPIALVYWANTEAMQSNHALWRPLGYCRLFTQHKKADNVIAGNDRERVL